MGYSAEMVMLVYVLFESICAVGRILFLHININLSIMQYLRNVCFGGIPVFILNALILFYKLVIFVDIFICCSNFIFCFSVWFERRRKEYNKENIYKIKK